MCRRFCVLALSAGVSHLSSFMHAARCPHARRPGGRDDAGGDGDGGVAVDKCRTAQWQAHESARMCEGREKNASEYMELRRAHHKQSEYKVRGGWPCEASAEWLDGRAKTCGWRAHGDVAN